MQSKWIVALHLAVLGIHIAPAAAQAQYAFTTDNRAGVFAGSGGATTLLDNTDPIRGFIGAPHSSTGGSFRAIHAFLKKGEKGEALRSIIDNNGDLAFTATLADGRSGIFRASAAPESGLSTLVAVALLWTAGFLCRRRV
ncbi:MAG: hypothetical protein JWN14_3582 [Chthonomonadales bacterium]|nr:hypothetical protein [Chthonomonadales bacterium]